ncbi:MAG TPA: class I SAM-dependent methyltransferase [Terracidiphilus sp.]|jgi:2-polyprenyl-3-methyl-5-hydroxy-6-metoxy-1,4-benzoquinol methylase
MRSNSSIASVNVAQKLQEAFSLFKMRRSIGSSFEGINRTLRNLDDYHATYERLTGRQFTNARVLEIGFGGQPTRLIALMSMGIDVRGIDLDMPMLTFSPIRLLQIATKNGPERALKTAVRNLLFDRRDRSKLAAALRQRGYKLKIDPSRFLIGDAATFNYGPEPVDFVYSNDVFEHVPNQGLEQLMERLASLMSPNGVALITPSVYTGITGGHLTEWYGNMVPLDVPRKSEPWEHLRQQRYKANTYLNCLSRAGYREIFRRHFEIVEERVMDPTLGLQWLTPDVRAELSQWSEEELFSNRVEFALRPMRSKNAH